MFNFVESYCEFPNLLRRPMWRIWHNLLIRFDKDSKVNFMNYGYAELNGKPVLKLKNRDEVNRYCIQLYNHVVADASLENKNVLELGSGRGGGADFISRYYKPKQYTGIDISSGVIKFCNNLYKVPGLSFIEGRAEKIPVTTGSYDALVNVESARCYSDIDRFFREVNRVLKKNGDFLFADMIETGKVDNIRYKLKEAGFTIKKEKNITENVAQGLELDNKRRQSLIHHLIPKKLRNSFSSFAGTKGSRRFNSFRDGTFEYWSFSLSKN